MIRLTPNSNVVFFTGAGVSTDSGLKDFRGAGGIADILKVDLTQALSRHELYCNPDRFWATWEKALRIPEGTRPNVTHEFIAALEKRCSVTVVTQNVDTLHEAAGSTNVIHLHGEDGVECDRCHAPMLPGFARHENCGGKSRPRAVLYGERLPKKAFQDASNAISRADTLIVAGTSLCVYPAANLVDVFAGSHAYFISRSHPPSLTQTKFLYIESSLKDIFQPYLKQIT